MCTAINFSDKQRNWYFGRTMDFSYDLNPSIYICPRNYNWKNVSSNMQIKNKYSFIGMGQKVEDIVFADGVNEKGLAVASLYFPGFAKYEKMYTNKKYNIDSVNIVKFLLGNCSNIDEACFLLYNTSIIGIKDNITNTIAPLHWIIVDSNGKCLILENREDGMHLLLNPIGVLTNSPNLEWHITNLRNYMNLSPIQYNESRWEKIYLTPFGQGAGLIGIPGDFTPPSRFVRAAFLKSHVEIPNNKNEAIITYFHIMESVSIPKGIVVTSSGKNDYTQYTSFMDLKNCEYFIKTYNNTQIHSQKLRAISEINKIIEIEKIK